MASLGEIGVLAGQGDNLGTPSKVPPLEFWVPLVIVAKPGDQFATDAVG